MCFLSFYDAEPENIPEEDFRDKTKGFLYNGNILLYENDQKNCHENDRSNEVKKLFIIVGLGNPGKEYEGTRHNVGFEVIDRIAEKYNIAVDGKKHRALIGKGMIGGQKVILAKPQTYMNLSGESVRSLLDYYKVDETEELLVIYDDISMENGQIRIRAKGSAGGHNGIKNIIAHLNGQVFPRIKVGVGEKPPRYDLADYVLGHFSKAEQELMEEGYDHALHAAEQIIDGEITAAMNEYNRKKKEV